NPRPTPRPPPHRAPTVGRAQQVPGGQGASDLRFVPRTTPAPPPTPPGRSPAAVHRSGRAPTGCLGPTCGTCPEPCSPFRVPHMRVDTHVAQRSQFLEPVLHGRGHCGGQSLRVVQTRGHVHLHPIATYGHVHLVDPADVVRSSSHGPAQRGA